MTVADYAGDLVLFANTPAPVEYLLHSQEQAAGDIGFCVNPDKTEYKCCKPEGTISILNVSPLKSVDNFTYFNINVSSTESDATIRLGKAWTVINRLSII